MGSAIQSLSTGGRIAAAGGGVAFLGCLVPLEVASGMQSAMIPAVLGEMQRSRGADIVLVVPLSAVALVVLALCATLGPAHRRAMLGGATIALGSPWASVCLIVLFAANQASSSFGLFRFGGGVGIGLVLLALGFAASVAGGFIILSEAVTTARAGSGREGERV